MPRAQNVHAIVNAGFLFKLDAKEIITSTNIVFGNISRSFVRAAKTELALVGTAFNNAGLKTGLRKLVEELVAEDNPPEPSPECRKMIALGLFYKVSSIQVFFYHPSNTNSKIVLT